MNKSILSIIILVVSLNFLHAEDVSDKKDAQSRFESLSKLTNVIGTVEKYYVDELKLQEIVDKALKGLMQELDAHSTYMDKKYFKESVLLIFSIVPSILTCLSNSSHAK